MAWPSLLLIIGAFGFLLAIGAAMILQFSRRPPAGTMTSFITGLVLGVSMLGVFLVQDQTTDDRRGPQFRIPLVP